MTLFLNVLLPFLCLYPVHCLHEIQLFVQSKVLIVFPEQIASPKSAWLQLHQRLPYLHQHFLWTLDWPAVLGKPSKFSIGQIIIFDGKMSKTEQLRPQINRLSWYIKDKEQEIVNLLRDGHSGGCFTKQDKNTINQDLMELYREVEGANTILDDLLEDCTDTESD